MSKKNFTAAPKPKPPSDDAIAAFEQAGPGQDTKSTNVASHKPSIVTPADAEPTKRLSLDIPASLHRRLKTACSATNRRMAPDLITLIEQRVAELEEEAGIARAH